MQGTADETEYFPGFGLGATVVAVQSERENLQSLAALMRGEKYGWQIASQPLMQGKL
jgi:hypothetical protein